LLATAGEGGGDEVSKINTLWHVQELTRSRGWITLDESESEEVAREVFDAAVRRNATARIAKLTVEIVEVHTCQH
jgi:hypothetical protein